MLFVLPCFRLPWRMLRAANVCILPKAESKPPYVAPGCSWERQRNSRGTPPWVAF